MRFFSHKVTDPLSHTHHNKLNRNHLFRQNFDAYNNSKKSQKAWFSKTILLEPDASWISRELFVKCERWWTYGSVRDWIETASQRQLPLVLCLLC